MASTSPCLPEVCGDAALYADPDALAHWVRAVRDIQRYPDLRQGLIQAGHKRSLSYSWRSIAEIYLELMLQVDEMALR